MTLYLFGKKYPHTSTKCAYLRELDQHLPDLRQRGVLELLIIIRLRMKYNGWHIQIRELTNKPLDFPDLYLREFISCVIRNYGR